MMHGSLGRVWQSACGVGGLGVVATESRSITQPRVTAMGDVTGKFAFLTGKSKHSKAMPHKRLSRFPLLPRHPKMIANLSFQRTRCFQRLKRRIPPELDFRRAAYWSGCHLLGGTMAQLPPTARPESLGAAVTCRDCATPCAPTFVSTLFLFWWRSHPT